MGIYTNRVTSNYNSSNYTSVTPLKGEHFNYHELGIIAAAESAAIQNNLMKRIALYELASFEQTGNTDVFYEAVDMGSFFEKIKMFFKKIIDKIHQIFHTFIAKMSSWFGNNANFVKKYEKEIIKNWSQVSKDWEYDGYKYSHIDFTNKISSDTVTSIRDVFKKPTSSFDNKSIIDFLNDGNLVSAIYYFARTGNNKNTISNNKLTDPEGSAEINNKTLAKFREHLDGFKDSIRKDIIDALSADGAKITDVLKTQFNIDNNGGYDSKEYTEELHKVFRSGEDSKESLDKSKIEGIYGGSITNLLTSIKEFDKVRESLDKAEKAMVKSIDELINKMDKAENDAIKNNKDEKNKDKVKLNESIIQLSSLYQSVWGFIKEVQTEAFSACLQATKEACTQAKDICVKVIQLKKNMTESYDYSSNNYYTSSSNNFISSVKLI